MSRFLNRLADDDQVEGGVAIVAEALFGVAMVDGQAALHGFRRQLFGEFNAGSPRLALLFEARKQIAFAASYIEDSASLGGLLDDPAVYFGPILRLFGHSVLPSRL